jgi:chromosome segregation ATPase
MFKANEEIETLRADRDRVNAEFASTSAEITFTSNRLQAAIDEKLKTEANLVNVSNTELSSDWDLSKLTRTLMQITNEMTILRDQLTAKTLEANKVSACPYVARDVHVAH